MQSRKIGIPKRFARGIPKIFFVRYINIFGGGIAKAKNNFFKM
jgi:hypothetical protein